MLYLFDNIDANIQKIVNECKSLQKHAIKMLYNVNSISEVPSFR
jgi:hypothetical protein